MTSPIPYVKIYIVGDNNVRKELLKFLGLSENDFNRIIRKIEVNRGESIEVNLIFLSPNFKAEKDLLFDLYSGDADVIFFCISNESIDAFYRDYLPQIRRFFYKPMIIFTKDLRDREKEIYENLTQIGIREPVVISLESIKYPETIYEAIQGVILRRSDRILARKRRLLAKSLRDLDDEIMFEPEEKISDIKKELEDLL